MYFLHWTKKITNTFLKDVTELKEELETKTDIPQEPKIQKKDLINVLLSLVSTINLRITNEGKEKKKDYFSEELLKAYPEENGHKLFMSHLMLLHSFAIKHVSDNLANGYFKIEPEEEFFLI